MGIRIAVVGLGAFAQGFIPLFKAHPLIDEVALCDLDPSKQERAARDYELSQTYPSLDAVCESDVDAVALFTQNWLHGPQAVQALRAGKHVYSAVPPAISLEEMATLVHTVEETGPTYMLGETSYYRAEAIYCRQRYAAGDFGAIVYAEAEYYEDFSLRLYDVFRRRGGEGWREFAGSPPTHYATHSTSKVVSCTGAYMTQVSCQGFVDRADDGIFRADVNQWANTFSNESALFRMSDGSVCRINEFRRVGHPIVERLAVLMGTEATFQNNQAGAVWLTREGGRREQLDDLLRLRTVETELGAISGVSRIHEVKRLPKELLLLPTGSGGSHHFLVDDFVQACVSHTIPPNNVWVAARYAVPGIVAHDSAVRGGALLQVPDLGDPQYNGERGKPMVN